MTEIGSIMIFECAPGGTHIIEDHFIEETLEYESDRPVPYGERAERVVTSFGRGFIPLIQYRTNDLVVKIPHTSCGCGHWDHLRSRLHVDLADAHEGPRFRVELAPPGSLPRFELKAKRLVDKRPVAEYSA